MEPLTSTVLATLLITKMVEKLGTILGEKVPDLGAKVWEQVSKLKGLVKLKSPETAAVVEAAENAPVLMDTQPDVFGLPALSNKIETLAVAEPEIAELIEALRESVLPQLPESCQTKVVQNIMLKGIKTKGIKADELRQTASPDADYVEQQLLVDVEADGDLDLGKLIQN